VFGQIGRDLVPADDVQLRPGRDEIGDDRRLIVEQEREPVGGGKQGLVRHDLGRLDGNAVKIENLGKKNPFPAE